MASPRVIEHALDDVPALSRWTFAYLAREHGDLAIEIQEGREREPDRYQREFERFCRRTTLRALIARIVEQPTSNDFYLAAKNRLLAQPGAERLLADLSPPPSFVARPLRPDDALVWIGPAGTRTPLHFDRRAGALAQLRGTKRVWLVDPSDPDLEIDDRFGRLDLRDRPSLDLHPGQILYVPAGWFHEVVALEPSISVSFTRFA